MMHLARLTAALTLLATAACGDKSPAEVDPEAPPVSPTSTRPAPKEPDVSSRKMLGVGATAPMRPSAARAWRLARGRATPRSRSM